MHIWSNLKERRASARLENDPHQAGVRRLLRWSIWPQISLVGWWCFTALANAADLTDQHSAFLQALSNAPTVQAAQERIMAARQLGGAAGRLPDPMVSAGYSRRSTTADRWPMYDVMLEQPLPRWGERDAKRARASAETALSEAELLDSLGETAAEVATLLADADAAHATLVLINGQVTRARALQSIINSRVAAGTSAIAEPLAISSKLAALAVERDTLQRVATDAEHEVRGRLGLAPEMPLPPFAAPDRSQLVLERIPGVLAAQAKRADAEAMFIEARATRYPETAVGLRYEREQQPDDPMNTLGVEVRVSLPIWQGASDHLEASASARRRAAQRDAAAWKYRAQALVSRAQRASTVATTARSAAQATKARLDVEYDALIRAAVTQSGNSMMSVLEVLDRVSEAERLVIDAEAAARQADASLWRLAPPDLSTLKPQASHP